MPQVLVTGGSRGIGRAVAVEMARQGYDVVLTYHKQHQAALSVAAEIEALGRLAHVALLDVAAADASDRVSGLVKEFGCPDALVNNAGMALDGLFAMMSRDVWDQVLRANLGGFYAVTRPVIRQMLRRRSGRVVNIASYSGQRGAAGQVNYAASKAGLVGATKALAIELAPRNITVNAVAPGLILSDMTANLPIEKILPTIPMGRAGTPDDVAGAVAFLCSPHAAYITGQVLAVNGGLYT